MAKYITPDYSEQWASAGNIVAPNSAKIQAGHIVEKPNYEYMNWLQNRQDTAIAYSLQMGIVEWDSSTQYQYTSNNHASYVQRNGVVYKAIQTGVNKDPLTETAYWTIAFDDKGSAATVQTNLNAHITNYGTLTGLTNTTTARTNLDVYSKAEAAQKNGDATKLFSVANGTTGNEAVNKSQLDTKADKNGSASETFSVATATSAAHAVRKDQFDAKTGISTDTVAGIVEKATQSELNTGEANVWPDAATLLSGFVKDVGGWDFPEWLGGLQIRLRETTYTQSEGNFSVTFNRPFSNSCDFVIGVYENTGSVSTEDLFVQIVNKSSSGATFYLQAHTSFPSGTRKIHWLAIGR